MNDVVSEYRLWSIICGEPARLFTEEQRREAILNEKSGTITFDSGRIRSGHKADPHPWYSLESKGDAAVVDNQQAIKIHAHKYGVDPDLLTAIVYYESSHGWYDHFYPGNKTFRPANVNVEMWSGLSDLDPEVIKKDPDAHIELAAMMPSGVQGRVADPIYDIWCDSLSADGGRDGHDESASASSDSPSLPLGVSPVPAPKPVLAARALSKSMLPLGKCSS